MSKKVRLTKREFLRLSAFASGAVALAACQGAPTATPETKVVEKVVTQLVEKPVERVVTQVVEKPVEKVVTQVVEKPVEKVITQIVEKQIVATPTVQKPGRDLIGKVEGAEVITDPAKYPKTFKEAPALADLVKAGKLPALKDRLPVPEDVMVLKPSQAIGKYGGTMRGGFIGPSDIANIPRFLKCDKFIFTDYAGFNPVPCLAKSWKTSDDGKSLTFNFRKGMRYSDGAPWTTNDVIFWYEDMYLNKDLNPSPSPDMMINGKPVTIEKVDDYTIVFRFPEPYFLFEELMHAFQPQPGGGYTRWAVNQIFAGLAFAPGHYLKPFHSKYADKAVLEKAVKDGGFDGWVSLLKFKISPVLNADLPVMNPWKVVQPVNSPLHTAERNPYFWVVDTEGNQLPYIDKISLSLAENPEVLNLRAISGEYDWQTRHLQLPKLPLFLENQKRGNYTVRLDTPTSTTGNTVSVNLSYDADAEIGGWLRTADFRRALSLGIDRDQINEAIFMGLGTPGSCSPVAESPVCPGPDYIKMWSTLDTKKANEMLDKLGLDKKDGEGYRLRKDGKGRLMLELATWANSGYDDEAEMLKQHWKKIGIWVDIQSQDRLLVWKRRDNNELHLLLLSSFSLDTLWSTPEGALPIGGETLIGSEYRKWFASDGKEGKKPEIPEVLKGYDLYRSFKGAKPADRIAAAKEIAKIAVEQQWTIAIVGQAPSVRIGKNTIGNDPSRLGMGPNAYMPSNSHPSTWYYK